MNNYQRIYIEDELFLKASFYAQQDIDHYLRKVLRINNGYKIKIFNERCGEFLAQLTVEKKQIKLDIEKFLRPAPSLQMLHLGVCIVRNSIMPEIISQAVQLGVTSISPIISQYTNITQFNFQRYNHIAKEAIEQSGRCDKVIIQTPTTLNNFVDLKFDLLIWADEQQKEQKLANIKTWPQNLALLVGPEGGWSQLERNFLQQQQRVVSISFSQNILRTETACSAALAQIALMRSI